MRKKLLLTLTAFVMAIAMFSIIAYAGKEPPATSETPEEKGIKIDEVNFPDEKFRGEVKSFDTDKDGFLSEEEIGAVKTINLWGPYEKSELKGLEKFTSLEKLYFGGKGITFKDFYHFKNLISFQAENNVRDTFDFSKNTNLKSLYLTHCNIKEINLDNNVSITSLAIGNNKLENLDVSKLTNLTSLQCEDNYLTSLDLSNNTKLKTLVCSSNALRSLDLTMAAELQDLYCENNILSGLDLRKNTKLNELNCSNNALSSLDLSQNTELRRVYCWENKLRSLDLSKQKQLRDLSCYKNNLTALDVSGNAELSYLNCANNQIEKLDLKNAGYLYHLNCEKNKIEKLDLSNNVKLEHVICAENRLSHLDINNIKKTDEIKVGGNVYTIVMGSDRTYKLSDLPGKFDVDKASNWKGGTVKNGILTIDEYADKVTYTYDIGKNQKETFTLKVNEPDFMMTRLGGDNRVETAIEISKKFFGESDHVIVARSDDFPDSLTAGVLAKTLNAPILLTKTDKLDEKVAEEIKRLGAKYITIVGGKSAVSTNVAKTLETVSGVSSVSRIGGENRYETSALIANEVVKRVGNQGTAIIATGRNFADSLSISSYAAKKGYPILLVEANSLPEATRKAIKDLNIGSVYILGGNLAISKDVEKVLPYVTARIGGINRYETSKLIAEKFFKDKENCFIASGENFPDALVVGAPAATKDAPIVLTNRFDVNLYTKLLLENSKFKKVNIVGQYLAISLNVESKVETLLKKDK